MDPIELAQLPLATLALAAVFWVIIQLFKFAAERLDAERLRTARHNRLLYHAGHNRGVVLSTLSVVITELGRIAGEAKAEQNPPPVPETAEDDTPRGLRALLAIITAPSAPAENEPAGPTLAERIVAGGDFITTEERLDLEEVAKNLDTFDPDIAGLVLSFIEEIPMVYAIIDQLNELNDKSETAQDYLSALIGLQFSCLSAAISSRAIIDSTFRAKLRSVLTAEKSTPAKSAQALYALALAELSGIEPLYYWGGEGEPLLKRLTAKDIDSHNAPLFRVESLKVMTIRRKEIAVESYYAWPVVLILALGLMLIVEPVRDFLFPPEETPATQLNCSTKVVAGGAAETTCGHTAPDLATGLGAGQSAAEGATPD